MSRTQRTFFFIIFIFSLLGRFLSIAQIPEIDWVKSFGGTDYELIRTSRFDNQGNIINIGGFYGTVDFDPGLGQYQLQAQGQAWGTFIQKLDANGNFIWAKVITSPDHIVANDLEVGPDGSVYIAGVFYYHVVDFDPDLTKTHYVNGSTTSHSMFVLKLDSQGKFDWVNVQSGNMSSTAIELDTLGNFYQIGTFDDVIDKNPDPAATNSVYPHTTGVDDFFIQKLDTAGNQQWFKAVKGANDVQAMALKLNVQGEPVIAGTFKGPVDFDPGTGIYNLTSAGSNVYFSGFVLHLTTSGTFQSAVALQGLGDSEIQELQIDLHNNLFIAGTYDGQVDFDPGTGITYPFGSNKKGYFIEKIDSGKVMQWAHSYENSWQPLETFPIKLLLGEHGSIYASGYFNDDDLELEPGKSNGITLINVGLRDIFIAKHDSTGALEWGQVFGEPGNDRATSLIKDDTGNLCISGYFSNTMGLNPYDPGDTVTSSGAYDCFVLKFKSCPPMPSEVLLDTNTAALSWNYSNAYPGTYNLSWYSCDSDSLISGEHDTTFSPAQNGNYALIIEKGGCSDTSDCFSIQNVGLDEKNSLTAVELFPNPTDNILYISGLNGQSANLTVMDVSGRRIIEANKQDFIDLSKVKPGTYFVWIEVDGIVAVKQVVRR